MLVYFKDFLLNIFLICSPLVFYPYVYKIRANKLLFAILLYILFSFAIVTTMLFPIDINGLTYDFRSIPIVVGSLYGGPAVAAALYGTLVVNRFILGGANNGLYILAVLPSLLLILFALRKYASMMLYQKVITAIVLCTLMKLITFLLYFSYINRIDLFASNITETLETYIVQGVIIGFYIYAVEMLKKYFYMQDELYKSERIKMVSEMAASVAHEIRNPLTTARGFIQMLGSAQVTDDKKAYYQQICLEELNRAEHIISEYLSLAKPEPETIEKIEVHKEIGYLSDVLHTYAHYNRIEIEAAPLAEQTLCIAGDRHKFRQALVNIGKNAIEAMPEGGVLSIEANRRDRYIVMSIRDTGVGMTPEQVNRLGTPYYSTKDKGTGLGTMVSFAIINKMNGKIEISSELGKGTEYRLIFPVEADVEAAG